MYICSRRKIPDSGPVHHAAPVQNRYFPKFLRHSVGFQTFRNMADFEDIRTHRSTVREQPEEPAVQTADKPGWADASPLENETNHPPLRARNITAPPDTEPEQESETPPSSRKRRRPFRLEEYAGQVLSGNILTRAEVRRQYPYIFFMALLMLLYIANGYHIQKLHRRHDKLTEQIKELRSRSLTLSSIRMTATRQSSIIQELKARNIPLRESLTPPKVIEQ